jgi:predicted nucleic acid-binding protein
MPSSLGTIFVDTSAWKAFYDEEDDQHDEARSFMKAVGAKEVPVRTLVTSDYIMDETLTLIRFAHSHSRAVEFANAVSSSRAIRVVFVGEEIFNNALELFTKRADKPWSLTDCVSFALMKRLELTTAFAFDPHFQQAGFETLPR